ncbi:CAP domain-containing protein, partial [Candidatus Wolfebacteria bacterium]|nr:CAP domain-containing protein [Candidatus Wolfebacteria bacterium]
YAGENLAVNFFDSEDAVNAWMKSITHRENILNTNFKEIGIGVAKGNYNGKESIFVVQLFGSPILQQSSAQVYALEKTEKKIEKSTPKPISPKTEQVATAKQNKEIPPASDTSTQLSTSASARLSTSTAAVQIGRVIEKITPENPKTIINFKSGQDFSKYTNWAQMLAEKIISSPFIFSTLNLFLTASQCF